MTARSIATRTGDDGTTGLLYGQRVPKDHPQVEAVGSLDELNAGLGAAKAAGVAPAARDLIAAVQQRLVALMGEVACAEADAGRYAASKFAKLEPDDLARIDRAIAALEAKPLALGGWATPGANPAAAALDVARTTARRAERRLAALPAHGRRLRPLVNAYINRLADLLWLLAREAETTPEK
jgi:cob(I)alamin adenosyltransferase